ncbi:uncharacterized protein LOC141664426 [Apium graveolens]|uniref:uncharacterized protein LOC141664426 n=1 Tax=Apium graveolens TaxID=4045 RepID=UPI003D78C355
MSPFKILYGRDPPLLMKMTQGQSVVNSVEELLQERDAILADLHFNLVRAQHMIRQTANSKRREDSFEVNDWLYLRLQPYLQRSLAKRPYEKLAARFYGPFKVTKRVGMVAYELGLPESNKLHPIFHISQLKRSIGVTLVSPPIPPHLSGDMEMVVEPEAVLEVRQMQRGLLLNSKC